MPLSQAFACALEHGGRRGIVILGEPGSGKTTHMKRLFLAVVQEGPEACGLPEGTVPVYLPLRHLRDTAKNLRAFIEEYGRFLRENSDVQEPEYWGNDKFNQPKQPVVGVSWHDAKRYCAWAGLRLPSEAEWEYACRAGTTTRYHSGDGETDLDRVGWYKKNAGSRLHPVGEKEPNGFGLYDMHGNVYEWCEDTYHDSYKGAPNDGSAWVDEGPTWRRWLPRAMGRATRIRKRTSHVTFELAEKSS